MCIVYYSLNYFHIPENRDISEHYVLQLIPRVNCRSYLQAAQVKNYLLLAFRVTVPFTENHIQTWLNDEQS